MPSVLIVEPAGRLWGSERALLDLLEPLVGSDWSLAVACPGNARIVEQLRALGVRTLPSLEANTHLRGKGARLRSALGLLGAAIRIRPDLLHVNQAGAARLALWVGRILRLPVSVHVRLTEDVAYLKRLGVPSRRVSLLLCVSDFVRGLFGTEVDDRRIVSLYDPYRPTSFGGPAASRGARADDIDPAARFVCVGRIDPEKGQHLAVEALARLRAGRPGVSLTIVGSAEGKSDYERDLENRCSAHGLRSAVEWLGFVEEPMPEIRRCGTLLCPSHKETLGRVIFEAWDAGAVPVAWEGSGGPAEVIGDSDGGLLYARATPESLAGAMARAMDLSPDERQAMIDRGREWLRTNCDPKTVARQVTAHWDRIVGGS